MLEFEWDETKRLSNIKNHGIDFEEAKPVFEDLNALDVLDGRFDYGEERWVIIGRGAGGLLAVVYVERDGVNRIISARLATKKETDVYVVQKDAWN